MGVVARMRGAELNLMNAYIRGKGQGSLSPEALGVLSRGGRGGVMSCWRFDAAEAPYLDLSGENPAINIVRRRFHDEPERVSVSPVARGVGPAAVRGVLAELNSSEGRAMAARLDDARRRINGGLAMLAPLALVVAGLASHASGLPPLDKAPFEPRWPAPVINWDGNNAEHLVQVPPLSSGEAAPHVGSVVLTATQQA